MATVRACCISFGAFWAHGQGSGLGPLHSPVQCCAQAEGPCVLSGHLERGALWCERLSPCRASLHLMLHDSKLHSISALRPAIFQSLADSVTSVCFSLQFRAALCKQQHVLCALVCPVIARPVRLSLSACPPVSFFTHSACGAHCKFAVD